MSDAIDGTARWSGEHWINYIRRPGELADSGSVSLFHTRYSEAGEGNVAFVDIPGAGLTATCTDNRELAAWLFDLQIRGRGNQFDRDLPMLDTQFWRGGDVRTDPSWRLEAGDHELVSQWSVTDPAVIHWGPTPSGVPNMRIFALLFFTYETSLTHNGTAIEGAAYTRDIWKPTIGGNRSSCVFALGETTFRVPA